jgi:hypothetical protein
MSEVQLKREELAETVAAERALRSKAKTETEECTIGDFIDLYFESQKRIAIKEVVEAFEQECSIKYTQTKAIDELKRLKYRIINCSRTFYVEH